MDKFEIFEKLKAYSKDLSTVSYEEIFRLIKDGIKKIPIPIAKIHKGANIDRVRHNNISLFRNISELSYIKDENIINNNLKAFGRANCPYQVMFYGALKTTKIDKQRLTAIAETSHLFRENINSLNGECYTLCRWHVKEEFQIVEIVFSDYALENNIDIAISFQNQIDFLNQMNLDEVEIKFYSDFLKFISEEFAKKVISSDDYKISAAYTNIVLLHPYVAGLCYPSVQTEYFGVNIVLNPKAVDKYLIPKIASTLVVYKNGKNSFITNGKYYCDKIDNTNELSWKEHDKSILSTKEEIKMYLKL